jgi:hypothetical protein
MIVDADLEGAAAGSPQRHLRVRSDLADEVRRLTGARLIVSLTAVFDLNVHGMPAL